MFGARVATPAHVQPGVACLRLVPEYYLELRKKERCYGKEEKLCLLRLCGVVDGQKAGGFRRGPCDAGPGLRRVVMKRADGGGFGIRCALIG